MSNHAALAHNSEGRAQLVDQDEIETGSAGDRVRSGRQARQARRTLPDRVAYWLVAAVIGLCLFASVVPSPCITRTPSSGTSPR